jgi:hypothetical protein
LNFRFALWVTKNPNFYLFHTNHRAAPNRRRADMTSNEGVYSPNTAREFQMCSNSSNNRHKNIRENRSPRKTSGLMNLAANYTSDSESG